MGIFEHGAIAHSHSQRPVLKPVSEIEIGLEFNQSEERKQISSIVNFALIYQNPI